MVAPHFVEKPLHRGETKVPFWTKEVELYKGGYDSEEGCEGSVRLTLYTDDPPADPNEGLAEEFESAIIGEAERRSCPTAPRRPDHRD